MGWSISLEPSSVRLYPAQTAVPATLARPPNLGRNALTMHLHLALVTDVWHMPATLPGQHVQPGSQERSVSTAPNRISRFAEESVQTIPRQLERGHLMKIG